VSLIGALVGLLVAAVVVWLLGGVAGLPGLVVGIAALLAFAACAFGWPDARGPGPRV
jgi:hypothetical protein